MNNIFDIAPFAYVGNSKDYKELSKEELDNLNDKTEKPQPVNPHVLSKKELDDMAKRGELNDNPMTDPVDKEALPSSDEVEESSASVVGPMLPQVGLTVTEEPNVDNVINDINEEAELLKEALEDTVNGANIYFEKAGFIDALKKRFKKDSNNEESIDTKKIMEAASIYTNLQIEKSRMKIIVVKDPSEKDNSEYRNHQKKLIELEKQFRNFKKTLNKIEEKSLNDYIRDFDVEFKKHSKKHIDDIKDAKKALLATESVEDCTDSELEIIQESAVLATATIAVMGLVAYSVIKTKKGNDKIKKCASILKETEKSFIDPKDMTVKRYKLSPSLTDPTGKTRGKEITNKLLQKLADRHMDVYSYKGKEIFSYISDYDDEIGTTLSTNGALGISASHDNKFYFNLIDNSLSKFETFYLAYATNKAKFKQAAAWNWAEDFIKTYEKNKKEKDVKESVDMECGNTEIVTERDLDPEIKPLIEKLHKKGYKTRASSSGHKNVTIKKDGDKDNVARDHFYGDARLVFDKKYNLGKAPKYWYWKKVDDVDYLDIMQIAKDESPDNEDKFNNWKDKYMNSLSSWVDSLPDISDKDNESVEECATESGKLTMEDINAKIDELTSRINHNEKLQSEWEAKHGESNPSLYEQHDKLCDEMEALCKQRREFKTESSIDIDRHIDMLFESAMAELELDIIDL